MTGVSEDEVSLNDKRVEVSTFDRYKGRKGMTDRLSILSSSLLRVRTHYHEAKKKSFKCLSQPGKQAVCCKHMGEADQKFGIILFHHLTDESGDLLAPEKLSGKVKLWVITDSRYSELSTIHKEFPLLDGGYGSPQVDLLAKCTEEQFQRMNFTPCKEAHWKRKQEWYDVISSKVAKAKPRLVKAMGNELTELEILDLLQIDSEINPSLGAGAGDIDLDDVLG